MPNSKSTKSKQRRGGKKWLSRWIGADQSNCVFCLHTPSGDEDINTRKKTENLAKSMNWYRFIDSFHEANFLDEYSKK